MEGATMEISFTSDLKGIGRFPSGKNMGSGVTTQYPHGVVDASYKGTMMTAEGDQFSWWAHEKSKVTEGGRVRGVIIVTAFTTSQKLLWINRLVLALESDFDPATQQFNTIAYEWV
ncbi:MAG TPA: hypothetical protein VLA68_01055, partial [Nitrososphaera sp.]|nr:hypothetical protein [Nitrososphaera sp.]